MALVQQAPWPGLPGSYPPAPASGRSSGRDTGAENATKPPKVGGSRRSGRQRGGGSGAGGGSGGFNTAGVPAGRSISGDSTTPTNAAAPLLPTMLPDANPVPDASSPASGGSDDDADAAKNADNAVTARLQKTKMCYFFERGKCASQNCRYAHSTNELRRQPNLQKTKLCKVWAQEGKCRDGENCVFAHGESELRVTEGIYKTQMCNFYERGRCLKGDRCNHAHGIEDLCGPAARMEQAARAAEAANVSQGRGAGSYGGSAGSGARGKGRGGGNAGSTGNGGARAARGAVGNGTVVDAGLAQSRAPLGPLTLVDLLSANTNAMSGIGGLGALDGNPYGTVGPESWIASGAESWANAMVGGPFHQPPGFTPNIYPQVGMPDHQLQHQVGGHHGGDAVVTASGVLAAALGGLSLPQQQASLPVGPPPPPPATLWNMGGASSVPWSYGASPAPGTPANPGVNHGHMHALSPAASPQEMYPGTPSPSPGTARRPLFGGGPSGMSLWNQAGGTFRGDDDGPSSACCDLDQRLKDLDVVVRDLAVEARGFTAATGGSGPVASGSSLPTPSLGGGNSSVPPAQSGGAPGDASGEPRVVHRI